MSKGGKTGGRDFKPGETGNPHGRPLTPEDVKVTRVMPQAAFDTLINELSDMPAKELAKIAKSTDTPALKRMLAKTLYLAGRSGDPKRMEVILNRMYGRPKVTEGESLDQKPAASFVDLARRAEAVKRRGNA